MNDKETLADRYRTVRSRSLALCAPLAIEDYVPQPVGDVSPPKWHLAHTTWFFETFVLQAFAPGHRVFDPGYAFLFNSYYEGVGPRVARIARGALSRPTVAEVFAYRAAVDEQMLALLTQQSDAALIKLVTLGLQHEQQHQELLLTDLKYILCNNPLRPIYDPQGIGPVVSAQEHAAPSAPATWLHRAEGEAWIGHDGTGFAFDNEGPRHRVLVPEFELRSQLVSNAEYLEFMRAGGYQRFELWHSEGWDWVRAQADPAPLYWQREVDGAWRHATLAGLQELQAEAPVTHINFYEAHAFCQWAGWRLPTEFEWESLAGQFDIGQRWEWAASAYLPYPRFKPAAGAVGEYNGKFMANQMVLRGASFATPPDHARLTYRNFFHPPLRWQYTGLRPARDTKV